MFASDELSKLLDNSKFGYTVQNAEAHHAAAFVAATRQSGTGTDNDDNARFGIDLEVAFRKKLGELLASGRSAEVIAQGRASSVFKLIHFSVQVAFLADQTGIRPALTVKKAPFLLLEDTFEWQACAILPDLWASLLVPLAPLLTSEALFSAGKNMLLRMCNSLLRRLSRTCQTELVGSIKMFLASAFPINDPSAVNLQRRHNQNSNVQFIDDSEAYALSLGATGKEMDVVEMTERVDTIDAKADDAHATTDSAATGPLFKYRLDAKDFAPEVKDKSARTFEEYVKFWKLQALLSAEPRGSVDPLPLLQSCKDALSLMESCVSGKIDVESEERTLLLAMNTAAQTPVTSTAQSGEEIVLSKTSTAHPSSVKGIGGGKGDTAEPSKAYLGVRYLTSPELLPLQLCSHQFRQQLAVQILLSCQSLRAHYRTLALAYVPAPTDASATKAAETVDAETPVRPDPRNPRAFESWLAGQLRSMEDRSFRIVTAGPQGKRLAALLRRVLFRELNWGYWKLDQCPTLTRESASLSVSGDRASSTASKSEKQPDTAYIFPKELSVVRELLRVLYEAVPSYDTYLADFLDAEDPDNGIEDEYHPRHDKIYCWRASRLLAERCVTSFSTMQTGDLRAGLKYTTQTNIKDADHTRPIIVLRERPQPEITEQNREPEVAAPADTDQMDQQEVHTNGDEGAMATIPENAKGPALDIEADESVEDKPVEDKPVEDKPVEDKPVEDKPADSAWIHITCYSGATTEADIREYVEKFASVTDVRMIPAQRFKNGGNQKYSIVGTTSAGASAFLNVKKHILKDASLKVHLVDASGKGSTAMETERNHTGGRESEEGEEPDTLTQARKRRRA